MLEGSRESLLQVAAGGVLQVSAGGVAAAIAARPWLELLELALQSLMQYNRSCCKLAQLELPQAGGKKAAAVGAAVSSSVCKSVLQSLL